MRRAMAVAAAVAGAALLGVPAAGAGGRAAAGGGDLGQPRVRDPGGRRGGITEGKFDRVSGKDVLVVTGPVRLQDLRRQRPEGPAAAGHVPAARARRVRLLAERGHGARHAAQADHRRARPAAHREPADRARPDAEAGIAARGCKSGFYVISYADPANLRQIGDFVELPSGHTSSCIQELPVHLDRRPGPRAATRRWTGSGRSSARGPDPAAERRERRSATAGRSG